MPETDDSPLIEASRHGDLDAFSRLVLRHQGALRACLAVRLDEPHHAEDLAQEVFILAFRKLAEFDPQRPFAPWLRGIAFNLLRNHRRKIRAISSGDAEDLQSLVDAEIDALHQEGHEADWRTALETCLGQLDEAPRHLVRARYEDDIDVAEICRRSGKKHSAVTMQLHRIRLQLRACIERRLGLARTT
ncbi:MAG TPA: sigma-70 family RNA polymerase sigma factor [Verrucomicrobiae bacterium]|nr:sigma-70 family RNA polymerase sigma factor [Verrucomicrobiae bacterium]